MYLHRLPAFLQEGLDDPEEDHADAMEQLGLSSPYDLLPGLKFPLRPHQVRFVLDAINVDYRRSLDGQARTVLQSWRNSRR